MAAKKRQDFFTSEEGMQVRSALQSMEANPLFNTVASYSVNTASYPDHSMPFVDKHMQYLNSHPSINPDHYLANLRLMSRVR